MSKTPFWGFFRHRRPKYMAYLTPKTMPHIHSLTKLMSSPPHKTYVVPLPGGPCGPKWDPKCPHTVLNGPHHVGYRWKPWEKGFQTSQVPWDNSPSTPSSAPSNPGTPHGGQTREKGPLPKNCVSFESHISRIPLGDSNCRNGHFKEKCKGFPMIPSFLADSPPVSRSGALKLAQGPLFAHPFMLDCTKNHPQPPVDPKKGTYSIQHWHEHGNEHGHKSGCHTSAKAAAVAMFASPMGAG